MRRLVEKIKLLTEENETLQQQVNDQSNIKGLKNQIEELLLEKEESKRSLIHFMTQSDEALKDVDKWQKKAESSTKEAKDMKVKLTELVKAHKKRDSILRDTEKKYEEIQRQLEQQEKANHNLQEQYIQLKERDTTVSDLSEKIDQLSSANEDYDALKKQLDDHTSTSKNLSDKIAELEKKVKELEDMKIREGHLKTLNKVTRVITAKPSNKDEEDVNMEYLRNVVLKFLESKSTRAQLVPVLTMLLKFSPEEIKRLQAKV
ncbi:GRIP domain-containing protein [Cunninghamella echinulata]|nr:GRIP domain-containing protein [Cunninghamella echinulata]